MTLSSGESPACTNLDALIRILRERILAGGDASTGHDDPALAILMLEVGSFMRSSCVKLAFHLRAVAGMEVVVLEAYDEEWAVWKMVHAAGATFEDVEVAFSGDGPVPDLSLDVVDAIGAGPMGDRLPLYGSDRRYRLVSFRHGHAPYLDHYARLVGDGGVSPMRRDPALTLPSIARFLDRPFDLPSALGSIRGGMTRNGLVLAESIPGYEKLMREVGLLRIGCTSGQSDDSHRESPRLGVA